MLQLRQSNASNLTSKSNLRGCFKTGIFRNQFSPFIFLACLRLKPGQVSPNYLLLKIRLKNLPVHFSKKISNNLSLLIAFGFALSRKAGSQQQAGR
jgi:hypothetical protein